MQCIFSSIAVNGVVSVFAEKIVAIIPADERVVT